MLMMRFTLVQIVENLRGNCWQRLVRLQLAAGGDPIVVNCIMTAGTGFQFGANRARNSKHVNALRRRALRGIEGLLRTNLTQIGSEMPYAGVLALLEAAMSSRRSGYASAAAQRKRIFVIHPDLQAPAPYRGFSGVVGTR